MKYSLFLLISLISLLALGADQKSNKLSFSSDQEFMGFRENNNHEQCGLYDLYSTVPRAVRTFCIGDIVSAENFKGERLNGLVVNIHPYFGSISVAPLNGSTSREEGYADGGFFLYYHEVEFVRRPTTPRERLVVSAGNFKDIFSYDENSGYYKLHSTAISETNLTLLD